MLTCQENQPSEEVIITPVHSITVPARKPCTSTDRRIAMAAGTIRARIIKDTTTIIILTTTMARLNTKLAIPVARQLHIRTVRRVATAPKKPNERRYIQPI